MEILQNRGYRNPFWIVTKGGYLSDEQLLRIQSVVENGNKVIVSICWTNNLKEIEPIRHNRFLHAHSLNKAGVHLNWYLRPLVEEWNASKENIEEVMKFVKDQGIPIKSIVVGGLRWTSGIEYGMVELHNLSMPELNKKDNKKTLSQNTINNLKEMHFKYFNEIPMFFKSSCSLSFALNLPSINCINILDGYSCKLSNCSKEQREVCSKFDLFDVNEINAKLYKSGYRLMIDKENISLNNLDGFTDYETNVIGLRILNRILGEIL